METRKRQGSSLLDATHPEHPDHHRSDTQNSQQTLPKYSLTATSSQNSCKNDIQSQSQRYRMDQATREKFAEIISEMRANRSYRAFARLLGVTHPTIKAWENLEGIPDQENLERIASFRGETLEEFKQILGGVRQPSRLQKLVQEVRVISHEELSVILHVIAERMSS